MASMADFLSKSNLISPCPHLSLSISPKKPSTLVGFPSLRFQSLKSSTNRDFLGRNMVLPEGQMQYKRGSLLHAQATDLSPFLMSRIKKFKDALAKHSTDRCSLGPPKGLEESQLLALAGNRDLSFNYTAKPVPAPAHEMAEAASSSLMPPLPSTRGPSPLKSLKRRPLSRQGDEEETHSTIFLYIISLCEREHKFSNLCILVIQ